MKQKLWQTSCQLDQEVEDFETKDDLTMDQKLIKYDVSGSLAHAKMLFKIGILTQKELADLEKGLSEIAELDKIGQFQLKSGDEDVHTKIENYLTENYGEAGKKIHTGRSRNEQVLTAIRLYSKDKLKNIVGELQKLEKEFLSFAKKYKDIPMPGYTHMQKAMPSGIGMWAGSFADSLADDFLILQAAYKLNDQSPLGSGAGYGVPLDVKRIYTASQLGFAKVQRNSLYCQNSRGKIEAAVLAACISLLSTLNKFASDVMLFTTAEFGFFKVDASVCTGSSIMPQKNNVDIAELLRCKVHLVLSHYVAIVSLSSNLPSGYNRDLQDSKKPLLESLGITFDSLKVCQILLTGLKPDVNKLKKAMTDDLYAVNEALKLSQKGMAFRTAYRKIASRYR